MFADVEPGSSHATAIAVLGRTRVLRGDASGRFHPEAALTRGDLALAMASALGLNADNPAPQTPRFADLGGDPALIRAVLATAGKRMVVPRSATEFGPRDHVSREELAYALAQAFPVPGGRETKSAAEKGDDGRRTQPKPAIDNVIGAGYMRPRDDRQVATQDPISRAEAAETIYAALSDQVRRRERNSGNFRPGDNAVRDRSPDSSTANPRTRTE